MADRIQQRRDTAARWAQYNPVLLEGEVGYVTDNPNRYKIGNGIHAWNDLPLRGYTGTISQETGSDENAVMSQKATTEKLTELAYKVGYIGLHTTPAILNTELLEDSTINVSITIPDYIYIDNKLIKVKQTYSANIPSNKMGMVRVYLKHDLSEIQLGLWDTILPNNESVIYIGSFSISSNGSVSKPYFYGNIIINNIKYAGFQQSFDYEFSGLYNNELNKKYDTGYVGLHTNPATININTVKDSHYITLEIPDFIYTNRQALEIKNTLTCELTNSGLTLLFIKKSNKTLHCLDYIQRLIYDTDTVDYILIGMLTASADFLRIEKINIFGRCNYNGELYINGIKISGTIGSDNTSAISQKEATRLSIYNDRRLAIQGLHTNPTVIDIIKEDKNYYITAYIKDYIYAETNNIKINTVLKAQIEANGLTTLWLKKDGTSMIAIRYNGNIDKTIANGYCIFLGVCNVDMSSLQLTNMQFWGKWTYRGKSYSSVFPDDVNTKLLELEKKIENSASAENMYMYAYGKMYLIKDEEYELFKDSFYYDKQNGFRGNSNIIVTTDTDVFAGNNLSVRFNTRGITSYAADNGEKNKLSIYIDNSLSKSITGYGVRCDLIVTDNISEKSIKHTAIGDSQTDNGLIRTLGEYLKSKNFTYNGVGITSDGGYANEGRSGWRYENIIGRSNAQGWSAIEVIYPEGGVKSTDRLHKNPFIRLATDDDKRLYPTKCYTFTAESQSTANYLEKSYQDIIDEGGDTEQNFYIFDIANYYRVQHDWNGEGNPVDAISFSFSTNEFIIEGFTDETINRLIENVEWVIQRCREQLPNVKIGFIACPAWSYNQSDDRYKTVLKWFKRLTGLVDNVNTYIVQPHLFMSRSIYSYNRNIRSEEVNESMIKKYTSGDGIHYDSIGNYQYAKCLAGWIVSLVVE